MLKTGFKPPLMMLFFLISVPSFASLLKTCITDAELQKRRSKEIHQIYLSDQKDRENFDGGSNKAHRKLFKRDTKRRKRIAEIFAEKAHRLGRPDANYFKAMAIDRYLVSIDQKQLFATQYYSSEETGHCFCLQQVEETFPESERIKVTGKSIKDELDLLAELNKNNTNCPIAFCTITLKPSPKGTIPGYW